MKLSAQKSFHVLYLALALYIVYGSLAVINLSYICFYSWKKVQTTILGGHPFEKGGSLPQATDLLH